MKKAIAIAAAVLAASLPLGACTGQTAPASVAAVQSNNEHMITVEAKEEVKVVPDVADICYGVTTQNTDADTCQKQNTTDVNKVIDTLKAAGIEEASIQTSGYGLSPTYDWIENKQVITGYEMTTDITITGVAIDQVGALISDSVGSGVNNIQSVTYKSSSFDECYQEALKLAMESAKTKAAALAEAGGCKLGSIISVTEYSQYPQARYTNNQYSMNARSAGGATDTGAVMPGEVGVEASISVQFAIE